MMRTHFPGRCSRTHGQTVRVLVENGVGTPGLIEKARTKLVDEGFRFINGGNASPFNDDPSSVQVPDGTDKSIARGRAVAAVAGAAASSVIPDRPGADGRGRDRHPGDGFQGVTAGPARPGDRTPRATVRNWPT